MCLIKFRPNRKHLSSDICIWKQEEIKLKSKRIHIKWSDRWFESTNVQNLPSISSSVIQIDRFFDASDWISTNDRSNQKCTSSFFRFNNSRKSNLNRPCTWPIWPRKHKNVLCQQKQPRHHRFRISGVAEFWFFLSILKFTSFLILKIYHWRPVRIPVLFFFYLYYRTLGKNWLSFSIKVTYAWCSGARWKGLPSSLMIQ